VIKKILTSLEFRSNTLNILICSHLSSHPLAVLAELKPTPNRTNYIYDSRRNKKPENKQNKTAMIVLRVASDSIQNMNEAEDSNKNRNEKCKNYETTPKHVGNILQEMKTIERKRISKVDTKHTRLRRVKSESGT